MRFVEVMDPMKSFHTIQVLSLNVRCVVSLFTRSVDLRKSIVPHGYVFAVRCVEKVQMMECVQSVVNPKVI